MDFSDKLIDEIRSVSPRLRVERQFPKVPQKVWANTDILYTGNLLPDIAAAPRLRWVQLHSAGMDHIADHPIMQAKQIQITTASGVHATQMAEFALAMMLAFTYKLPTLFDLKSRAEWRTKRQDAPDEDLFQPTELRGQTLGIVGYGSVGRELARISCGMGMVVLATKRDLMNLTDEDGYYESGIGDPTGDLPSRLYPPEAVGSMARESDFLVVTLPLTDGTRHAVNKAILSEMKPNAALINVGRGGVIDEKALVDALMAKQIAGAALDVFEEEPLPPTSPLWKMDNVIISPHVSGASARYHEKAAAVFVENLQRFLEGRALLNRVKREHGY